MGKAVFAILAASLLLAAADDELLSAARKGDLAAVKAQLEKGSSLEAKTPYGQTPLYLAAMNGHEEVVHFLLDKGASADVRDTFYKAGMLDFVLQRKHYGVAKALIAKGKGAPDTYLEAAASSGEADLVRAVLEKGKPSQAALDKTLEMALDRKLTSVAEVVKQAGAQPPAPPFVVDPKVLDSYAGSYKSEQVPLEIKIFAKDAKLYAQATGQQEFSPKAKSATLFEHSQFGLKIQFDSPDSFTLTQGGREMKFKKAVKP